MTKVSESAKFNMFPENANFIFKRQKKINHIKDSRFKK